MKLKTLQNYENRRRLLVAAKLAVVLTLLFCMVGGAMAAKNETSTGLWDILKWEDIVKESKTLADGDVGSIIMLILGLFALIAVVSIVLGLLGGVSISNLGKVFGSNDLHAKGKSMMGVAMGTAICLVLGFALLAIVVAKLG